MENINTIQDAINYILDYNKYTLIESETLKYDNGDIRIVFTCKHFNWIVYFNVTSVNINAKDNLRVAVDIVKDDQTKVIYYANFLQKRKEKKD